MIIYNTTFHLEESIERQWLNWMKSTYIPLAMETGLFSHNHFCEVLVEEEMGGKTYSFQLFLKDMEHFHQFQNEFASKIQAVFKTKYANRVLTFSTLMKEV